MYQIRIDYMKKLPTFFDVHFFQLLPLAFKKEILGGRVIYETEELYEIAYKTIKAYRYLKKYREDYIKGVLFES